MAAIGLAAAVLHRRDPDVVLGSFAADHVITEPTSFGDAVRDAVGAAAEGYLVTIGITPSFAATGFGYIAPGDPLGEGAARRVKNFVEKPDPATAQRYVREGYVWNAGMFVVKAEVLLSQLDTHQPHLAAGLREIAAVMAEDPPAQAEETMQRIWPSLTKISIDHAVAEPVAAAGGMAVVPGAFAWDDVGDWDSLANILPGGDDAVRVLGPAELALTDDASGVVVPSCGRVIAVLGLSDVVVVDTADAVLVTTRARAQDVKKLVDRLKADQRSELT
jgi:mannose-1-phosphate guanylyltransferase